MTVFCVFDHKSSYFDTNFSNDQAIVDTSLSTTAIGHRNPARNRKRPNYYQGGFT